MWQLAIGFICGVIVGVVWAYEPPPDSGDDGLTNYYDK